MYKGESRVVNFLKINPSSVNTPSLRAAYLQLSSEVFSTPLLSPDYKVRIAFNITNVGLVDEGKAYFEQILKQDPKKSDAPQFLAEIYESQKKYPEAIKYRVITREVYPWNTANLLGLENDYLAMGDKGSAKAIRDSIVAMAPGTENALKADKAIGG
jgi:tetratricopeptide (TPR) repeat protein